MNRRLTVICRVTAALVLMVLPAAPALCQEASGAQAAPDLAQLEQGVPTAPVVVDGTTVFRVRGVSSYPAEQRADTIAGRIRAIAADQLVRPDALRIEETDIASRILAGQQFVMNVYDADAKVEGVRRQVLATVYLGQIRSAIQAYRADRTTAALERAALAALVATLVLAALVIAVVWVRRRLDALLDSRYRQKIDALAARSKEVVSVTKVWKSLDATLRFIRSAVIVALGIVYLEYVLALFPHSRPAAQKLLGWVVGPLETMWRSLVAATPDLIFLVVLVFVTRIVLRIIKRFFEAVEEGRVHLANFEREWAAPTYKLLRPAVVAFALIVGYPYIPGSGSEAFKGVSIFLGIVFSLGSSSFIANMIAGYSMTYRRAFKVGDFVKIGDVTGIVTAVRLQVTHLRTLKNEEVVFPNSEILNTHVTNFSSLAHTKGLILHTTVGIGYETPWRQVEAMLLEAARRTPGVLADPPPFVLHQALGDFCVTYELNAYCGDATKMKVIYTDLHRNILDQFNEYGVQIMTPAYEGDPEIPKVVPKDQWYLAPAKQEGEEP